MLLIFVVVVSLKDKKDSTCSNDFQKLFWRNLNHRNLIIVNLIRGQRLEDNDMEMYST